MKQPIICQHHEARGLKPLMVYAGEGPLGTRRHVCAVCCRMREVGTGIISDLKGSYGFIRNAKRDFFFHYKELGTSCYPQVGMAVRFELLFFDGGVQAIDIRPMGS